MLLWVVSLAPGAICYDLPGIHPRPRPEGGLRNAGVEPVYCGIL